MQLDEADDLHEIARENRIVPPQHKDIKLQLARGVIRATEAAGAMDQPKFLQSIDMPTDWLARAMNDPGNVPLDEYVRVFDGAAERAGWWGTGQIIREVVERQRFGHWP